MVRMARQDAICKQLQHFNRTLLHVSDTEYESTCSTKYGITIHIFNLFRNRPQKHPFHQQGQQIIPVK